MSTPAMQSWVAFGSAVRNQSFRDAGADVATVTSTALPAAKLSHPPSPWKKSAPAEFASTRFDRAYELYIFKELDVEIPPGCVSLMATWLSTT